MRYEVITLTGLLRSSELFLLIEELEKTGWTPTRVNAFLEQEEALATASSFFKQGSRVVFFTTCSICPLEELKNLQVSRLDERGSILYLDRESGSCLIQLRRREDLFHIWSLLPASWWEEKLYFTRTFYFYPLAEERIAPFLIRFPFLEARSTMVGPQLKVHFSGFKSGAEEFFRQMRASLEEKMTGIYLGEHPLQEAVGILLKKKNLSLAVAESCTGGLLSHLLTNPPGSSDYFFAGLVPYRIEAKVRLAGIEEGFFREHEVVSGDVALFLARNARLKLSTDLGLGLTGFAGPGGGTSFAPVGTVYIALSSREKEEVQEFHFSGARESVKQQSALRALFLLYSFLLDISSKSGL